MKNKDILAILPFDHRTGLYKAFGWSEPLSDDQITTMKDGRRLIYEAIQESVKMGVPLSNAPVFTDDIFGKEVLVDAKKKGFQTFLTTEKSGLTYFDFEHGEQFGDAINEVKPNFVKALVRYNPDSNSEDNQKSLINLKKLNDFANANGYKFLIEPLIPATDAQLENVGNDKKKYDEEVRPDLTVRMINEMHVAGVKPDIWKIEGFQNSNNYEKVTEAAATNIICLGRNETDEVVESWLRAGATVDEVIGFAVGRTVFLDPLLKYVKGEIPRETAIQTIAQKFVHFYNIFTKKS